MHWVICFSHIAPNPPVIDDITNISSSVVLVTWTRPAILNGILVSYTITYIINGGSRSTTVDYNEEEVSLSCLYFLCNIIVIFCCRHSPKILLDWLHINW